ncbi:MAG TPA: SDR family NAD(P)-dependent oxidoreductase, partial [Acidimicrobiia bacterium]
MSTAIITGGSMGFGKALATELATQDWNLVIDGRNRGVLDEAGHFLESMGSGKTHAIAGDVADQGHRTEMVDAAVEFGDFRLLVNNASILG